MVLMANVPIYPWLCPHNPKPPALESDRTQGRTLIDHQLTVKPGALAAPATAWWWGLLGPWVARNVP